MRASNKHDIVYFLEMQKELYSWSFPPPNQFFFYSLSDLTIAIDTVF